LVWPPRRGSASYREICASCRRACAQPRPEMPEPITAILIRVGPGKAAKTDPHRR